MNEQSLKKLIDNKNRIFIYGAGMVGSLVLLRLRDFGVNEDKIDFVVTKASDNQKYMGHNVYSIDNCDFEELDLIIVATMKKNQGQILNALGKKRLTDYILVDDELYEDMEREYIESFTIAHQNEIRGTRDVLFISSDNNYTSGAFLCMVDLCKGMICKGIKPLVVLPAYGNAEKLLQDNNIEYVFVRSRSGLSDKNCVQDEPVMNNEAVRKVESIIKKYQVKLVHNNSMHTYIGAVAAKNMGIPYIWHVRENVREQGLYFINEDYFYNLINSSSQIITVSKYVGKCYPRLDKRKTVCIYDGVDAQKYYYEHKILDDDTINILMPGIMVPLKGQHQLVEAAKGLKDAEIKIDISFVGSGDADYINLLEETVNKYGLNNMVHFYERVNNLDEWYKKTDVVVVCSRSEAFGRVTVEAQLAGCIVIGADCGATPEIIDDDITGILYELNNIEMLKEKIIKLFRNKEKNVKIAEKGQKKALELFDKSLNVNSILEQYKRIIGDNL